MISFSFKQAPFFLGNEELHQFYADVKKSQIDTVAATENRTFIHERIRTNTVQVHKRQSACARGIISKPTNHQSTTNPLC